MGSKGTIFDSDSLYGLQIINRLFVTIFVGGTLPYYLRFVYVALEPASTRSMSLSLIIEVLSHRDTHSRRS